jgi:hypothetical protein
MDEELKWVWNGWHMAGQIIETDGRYDVWIDTVSGRGHKEMTVGQWLKLATPTPEELHEAYDIAYAELEKYAVSKYADHIDHIYEQYKEG